jgi:hypothetical protein
VTIEFNGVVPSKKNVQIPKPQSTAAHHVRDEQPASIDSVVAEDFSSSPLLQKDPPQLLVPLRL